MREITEFVNEPLTDFGRPENRKAMEAALAKVRSMLGASHQIVIGAKRMSGEGTSTSTTPSRPAEIVGVFEKGTAELADLAVRTAHETFASWSKTPARERSEVLFKAAGLLRERKHEMSAWMIFEAGQRWAGAARGPAGGGRLCGVLRPRKRR